MAKPENFPEKQTWGTCEELLLACAVNRYGSDSWDSVATELQKRTSTLQHLFFTPLFCREKFQDLKRRFGGNDVEGDDAPTTNNNISTTAVPWLDELRKLRVAELRREVQHYDLSIVSLQLKVKKLKEERERSLRENGKETEKSDLEKEKESRKREEENEPEDQTKKPVHGRGDSDRENRSVNESNSTDPKNETPGTGPDKAKVEPEGCKTGKEVDNLKPAGENSCNGSCDSVAKESDGNSERAHPRREPGSSPESVAESKGGEPNRESSDVQSSASLSRKEKKLGEPNEPDEPDNEELDQSPVIKGTSIESQPLVEFLEIFRSHKLGSLFERRLESQETPDYLNLVRQHLDFETIRMRLDEGWYSGCKSKFFRDLLLLLNNAIIFFDKKSSEHTAAVELRQLVSKEIAAHIPRSIMLPEEQLSALPETQMLVKPEPEPSLSLSMKPKLSVPMIACRKRSSITARASTSSSGQEKKRQPIAALLNEKPPLDWKQHEKSSEKTEESLVTKKRTRETSSAGTRKAEKNVKSLKHTNKNKISDGDTNAAAAVSAISSKEDSSIDNSESKGEKEKTNTNVSSKKQSAANFLNRMKRSSSSKNGPLIETLKDVISSDNRKGDGDEQKKGSSRKGDKGKDQNSTRQTRSGGKGAKERGSPAKRSKGRPPKRAAAAAAATPSVPAKRGREVGNDSGTRQAKKRSRK